MWEQRGHAWHGGGIGGEELRRKEEDGRHKKTQNKNHTEIHTGLKFMPTQNHIHIKCSLGNMQICQIFDLPSANSDFKLEWQKETHV